MLGPILQVTVHNDNGIPRTHVEPGQDGAVLAEITGKVDPFDLGIICAYILYDLPGTLWAGIIDEDDLIIISQLLKGI